MKAVPIPWAERIGQYAGASRVAVVYLDASGNFGITTWGKTKRECRDLAKWAESAEATQLVERLGE